MHSVWLAVLALMAVAVSATAQGTNEAKVFKLNNRDAQELVSLAQQMMSPGGDASADARTNAIVATGSPAQLQQLGKILAELDGALKQVTLTVYVAEVSDSLRQRYGLKATGTTTMNAGNFAATLDLLDSQQGGQILSSMEATTMSGTPAFLQVSSDKFVTMPEQNDTHGSTTNAFDRIPVGEFLAVLPRVKPNGMIDVALTPTVSRSGQGNDVVKRTTSTHIIVPDGDTIVVGSSATTENVDGQQSAPLITLGQGQQSGSQQVMIFLTAQTGTGANMLPPPPSGYSDFDDPEVLPPSRPVKKRGMQGPFSH